MTQALSDRNDAVRVAAAEALGRIGPAAREAVPGFVRVWSDKFAGRRAEMRQVGVIIVDPPATPCPRSLLPEGNEDTRAAAAAALKQIDPAAVTA